MSIIIIPPIFPMPRVPSGGGGGETEVKEIIIVVFGVVGLLWSLLTIVMWLFPLDYGNPTLVDVIKSQYEFFASKRIY